MVAPAREPASGGATVGANTGGNGSGGNGSVGRAADARIGQAAHLPRLDATAHLKISKNNLLSVCDDLDSVGAIAPAGRQR